MKGILTIIFLTLGLFNCVSGQTYQALEKVLLRELPTNSTKDGRWVFYPAKGNIKKIDKPLVKSVIPNYDFYKVKLTNFLGYHIFQGTPCVILFDSSQSKIVLIEPIWYSGLSKQFVRLFIGHRFENKDILRNFLSELHELIQEESGYRFQQTSYNDSCAAFDLIIFRGGTKTTQGSGISSTVYYNEDTIYRKIIIEFKELSIIRYTSINPWTNDKEIIE